MYGYRLELKELQSDIEQKPTRYADLLFGVLRTPKQFLHPTTGEIANIGITKPEMKIRNRILRNLKEANDRHIHLILSVEERDKLQELVRDSRWNFASLEIEQFMEDVENMEKVELTITQ